MSGVGAPLCQMKVGCEIQQSWGMWWIALIKIKISQNQFSARWGNLGKKHDKFVFEDIEKVSNRSRLWPPEGLTRFFFKNRRMSLSNLTEVTTSCKISEKLNGWSRRKMRTNGWTGHFWPLLTRWGANKIFFQKSENVTLYADRSYNFMQNFKEIEWMVTEKNAHERTDGRASKHKSP